MRVLVVPEHVISIHTPLARSDRMRVLVVPEHVISIHTPLARSDRNSTGGSVRCIHFNPHSPCEE